MVTIYFIVHPEVVPDPTLPINLWAYSDLGIVRQQKLLKTSWIRSFDRVYSGPEARTTKAAQQIADALGYKLYIRPDLAEVNRSQNGMPAAVLSDEEFIKCDAEFFAHPNESPCGWEKALDVQSRAVGAVEAIAAEAPGGWHVAVISYEVLAQLILFRYSGTEIKKPEKPIPVGIAFEFDEMGKFLSQKPLEVP